MTHHSITRLRTRFGFTVLELLLYVTISSSVLLMSVMFMGALLEARVKNEVMAEVEQQGLSAMQTVTASLRNASGVTTPSAGSSGSVLTLATYAPLTNPTVFDVLGGTLRIKEGATSTVPLTNPLVVVSGFEVSNITAPGTPGSARVVFTLTYSSPSQKGAYTYAKTFTGTGTLRQP